MKTKIYTKTGDKGTTSLYGGERIAKNSPLINAIGNVDELNSLLGIAISGDFHKIMVEKLTHVQTDLFSLGADIATPMNTNEKLHIVRISEVEVIRLESEIDNWEKTLPELKNFILPGGNQTAAILHHARAVCRRAERSLVEVSQTVKINNEALKYLNRLSDWLFVAARYVNLHEQQTEVPWKVE